MNLDGAVPTAASDDEYGRNAVRFMRRITEIGFPRALEEEIAKPQFEDPSWCRMLVNLVADHHGKMKPQENGPVPVQSGPGRGRG